MRGVYVIEKMEHPYIFCVAYLPEMGEHRETWPSKARLVWQEG